MPLSDLMPTLARWREFLKRAAKDYGYKDNDHLHPSFGDMKKMYAEATAVAKQLEQAEKVSNKPRCEHCGSDRIYSGPPDHICGAPVCCTVCCREATLETTIATLTAENEKLMERIVSEGRQHNVELMAANGIATALTAEVEKLKDHPDLRDAIQTRFELSKAQITIAALTAALDEARGLVRDCCDRLEGNVIDLQEDIESFLARHAKDVK
jgi:hypothetical protein